MKVWKYGDDINTDLLFPGKYTYTCSTPEEILPHLFEDLDPSFSSNVREGDIIIAGRNFGCGSSREQPVLGLKAAGISAIIARSFARIFFRAGINQGLRMVECPEAVEEWEEGKEIGLFYEQGRIVIGEKEINFPKPPPEILKIIEKGGLLPYVEWELEGGN